MNGNENKDKKITFEAKCRRCENLLEYSLGNISDWDYDNYESYIETKLLKHGIQHNYCNQCNKYTVQDIVSYVPPENFEVMKKENKQQEDK